ncbi:MULTISPECIES: cytidine deaminase [unclassified Enterococcus]|uniref:cytidine deaminase n=1 Tax=unclassified Enterococcus TaxID=2608891 RepID=UPI0015550808|nr:MULTISPECIES: cytidine deaminase [unclassified Enterococcus]MBS7576141.1 cytidine deaminase [Enterococcus sp. MMGLQ5-2]MBS7583374.1 cytidine deaminase [Enterococcus sp. MMGLQ5-1]NPD11234.1 cytidine deaminase [Enterococcus sp. MMGLQ5-1]NPD35977.1 cytidine deaminase [Enterococcus sp. MMGLQ5-2]
MPINELIDLTIQASQSAYAPYSQFKVGATLVSKSGTVYQGCNIENVSYGLTNCAERTAIFKAISEGEQAFSKLYIYGETEQPISPCGACRQVMFEFFEPETEIVLISKNRTIKRVKMAELLPYQFKKLD